jgi:hypothetical protein
LGELTEERHFPLVIGHLPFPRFAIGGRSVRNDRMKMTNGKWKMTNGKCFYAT